MFGWENYVTYTCMRLFQAISTLITVITQMIVFRCTSLYSTVVDLYAPLFYLGDVGLFLDTAVGDV
jgi:hypothetical protein